MDQAKYYSVGVEDGILSLRRAKVRLLECWKTAVTQRELETSIERMGLRDPPGTKPPRKFTAKIGKVTITGKKGESVGTTIRRR